MSSEVIFDEKILSEKELERYKKQGWNVDEILNYYTTGKYKGKNKYKLKKEVSKERALEFKKKREKKQGTDEKNGKLISIVVSLHARKRIAGRLRVLKIPDQNEFIINILKKGELIIKKDKGAKVFNMLYNEIILVLAKVSLEKFVVMTVVGEVPFKLQARLDSKWGLKYIDNFFANAQLEIV